MGRPPQMVVEPAPAGVSGGTFEVVVMEPQATGRRKNTALAAAAAAALALVAIAALAVHSDGGASAGAQKAQLWTHVGADADTSTQRVAVTDADVNNLGLKAPAGFNVPSIEVSDADVARLGLKAPPGLNVAPVTVSDADIKNLGLKVPSGSEIPAMVVTDDDVERYGLKLPTAAAGSAGGAVQVTPADVERYGLVAPQGIGSRLNITVTKQDIAKLGLNNPAISNDEAKKLGIFGNGPVVTAADIRRLGMKLKAPSNEEAAALGLSNHTIRLSEAQAEAVGLTGPVSITPAEAVKLGLTQAAAGALVTASDLDRLGLKDPVGWTAKGFSHLPAEEKAKVQQVLAELKRRRARALPRAEAADKMMHAKMLVARGKVAANIAGPRK